MKAKVSQAGQAGLPKPLGDVSSVSFDDLGGDVEITVSAATDRPVVLIRTDRQGFAIRPLPRKDGPGIDVMCTMLFDSRERHVIDHAILTGEDWKAEKAIQVEFGPDADGIQRLIIKLPNLPRT